MTRVLVVGAGVAGLAAACHARHRGADVVLVDAADRLGGVRHARPHPPFTDDARAAALELILESGVVTRDEPVEGPPAAGRIRAILDGARQQANQIATGLGRLMPWRPSRSAQAAVPEVLADNLVESGVRVLLNSTVVRIAPGGSRSSAILDDGRSEVVDAVILAGGTDSSAQLLTPWVPEAAATLRQADRAGARRPVVHVSGAAAHAAMLARLERDLAGRPTWRVAGGESGEGLVTKLLDGRRAADAVLDAVATREVRRASRPQGRTPLM